MVEFKVGKEVLKGTLFIPSGKGPFPGVVFYHGRGSNRARYLPMAKELAKNGIMVFAFDFRGCGESDGRFEEQTHKMGIEDAVAALEFLLTQNIDKTRIGLCGSSFGGYVIGMILSKYPFVKSILLRSPAAYSDKFLLTTGDRENDFFENGENWKDSKVYKHMRNFRGAVMVLKCESDELLPEKLVDKYYQEAVSASQKELNSLKGANHSLTNPTYLEEFYRKTYDWFLKTL